MVSSAFDGPHLCTFEAGGGDIGVVLTTGAFLAWVFGGIVWEYCVVVVGGVGHGGGNVVVGSKMLTWQQTAAFQIWVATGHQAAKWVYY